MQKAVKFKYFDINHTFGTMSLVITNLIPTPKALNSRVPPLIFKLSLCGIFGMSKIHRSAYTGFTLFLLYCLHFPRELATCVNLARMAAKLMHLLTHR